MSSKIGFDEKMMEQLFTMILEYLQRINTQFEALKRKGINERDPEYQELQRELGQLYLSTIPPMMGYLLFLNESLNVVVKAQSENIKLLNEVVKAQSENIKLLQRSSKRLNNLTLVLDILTVGLVILTCGLIIVTLHLAI